MKTINHFKKRPSIWKTPVNGKTFSGNELEESTLPNETGKTGKSFIKKKKKQK